MDKLLRLRGIPDTADAWPWLQQLCVDIINTGKVGEFFQHRENEKVIHTEGHRGLLRNERKNFTAEKIQEQIHAEDAEEEIFSSPSPDSYLNPRFLWFSAVKIFIFFQPCLLRTYSFLTNPFHLFF